MTHAPITSAATMITTPQSASIRLREPSSSASEAKSARIGEAVFGTVAGASALVARLNTFDISDIVLDFCGSSTAAVLSVKLAH